MKFEIKATKKGHTLFRRFGTSSQVIHKDIPALDIKVWLIDMLQSEAKRDLEFTAKTRENEKKTISTSVRHQVNGKIINDFKTELSADYKQTVDVLQTHLTNSYLPSDNAVCERIGTIVWEFSEAVHHYYAQIMEEIRLIPAQEFDYEIQHDVRTSTGQAIWSTAVLVHKDGTPVDLTSRIPKNKIINFILQMATQNQSESNEIANTKRRVNFKGAVLNDTFRESIYIKELICQGTSNGFEFSVPNATPEVNDVINEIKQFFRINPFAGMKNKEAA